MTNKTNFYLITTIVIFILILSATSFSKLMSINIKLDKEDNSIISPREEKYLVVNNTNENPANKLDELNQEVKKELEDKKGHLLKTMPTVNIKENTEVSIKNKINKQNDIMLVPTNDLEILAKIIHAEASSEPYEGKVAVGGVILNRVRSSKFPNNIKDVVFATNQFEPVDNGSYQRAIPNSSDYKAAKEALDGKDPSEGALYFYAPSLTDNRWHETLTYIKTIGGHKFFR